MTLGAPVSAGTGERGCVVPHGAMQPAARMPVVAERQSLRGFHNAVAFTKQPASLTMSD
jgi:hypothetical protein